jgi:hypothetical protein
MTHTALTPLLGREYDRFLFAPVGEERNGMTLSVLSALARLDVDPWKETAALSSMPKDRAQERLAALIASTTKNLATNLKPEAVANRLIALLPSASSFDTPAPITLVRAAAAQPSKSVFALGVVAIVLIGFVVFTTHRLPLVGFGSSATTNEAVPAR